MAGTVKVSNEDWIVGSKGQRLLFIVLAQLGFVVLTIVKKEHNSALINGSRIIIIHKSILIVHGKVEYKYYCTNYNMVFNFFNCTVYCF